MSAADAHILATPNVGVAVFSTRTERRWHLVAGPAALDAGTGPRPVLREIASALSGASIAPPAVVVEAHTATPRAS